MSKIKRVSVLLLSSVLLALFVVGPALAAAPDNVYGLVFIDDDGDGVWDVGESGYDGEWTWLEDEAVWRNVGATITIITPAYDEYVLTSAGARAVDYDGETAVCSYQDTVVDDEMNESPVRPCSGTWGLPGVSEDVRYEVWLTAPDGYTVTSQNPLTFTTGSGQAALDFGIAPVADN